MKDIVIRTDKLTKKFDERVAVSEVSFQVKRGNIFGFLGPNGSGKSTVIKMLCGLLSPTSGKGYIQNFDCETQGNEIRKRVGYMSQKFGLYQDLTVRQNLEFYGRIYGVPKQKLEEKIKDLCHRTRLIPYMDIKSGSLSGGWKQRLALACSLLHDPSVLFLDEPTAGIDPVARREVWDLLFELSAEGMTLFVTTHYMDEAERCHEVAYIYLSKLIAIGGIDELIKKKELLPEGYIQIEIAGDISSDVYKQLKSLQGVRQVTVFGRSLHCIVSDRFDLGLLQDELVEVFGGKIEVRQIDLSLEDVFVILTNREDSSTK